MMDGRMKGVMRWLTVAFALCIGASGCAKAGAGAALSTSPSASDQVSPKVDPSLRATPIMTVQDPFAGIGNAIGGERLTRTIQLRTNVFVSPPPATLSPSITSDQALTDYVQQDGQLPSTEGSTPIIFLALLTNNEMGQLSSDGSSVSPFYQRTPVWVIVYHDIQEASGGGSGGGPPPSGETSAPETGSVSPVNVIAFVDATSGKWLYDIEDTLLQPQQP
jgi:hypothetical protein